MMPKKVEITYHIENDLDATEFKQVLERSTLGERRPVDDEESIALMLAHGNLIVTARNQGNLVGVARSLSDYAFCTYLSDLAVDRDFQKTGIGKELIRRTKAAAPKAKLILLAAPAAVPYYPKIGMTSFTNCFVLDNVNELK